MDEDWDDTLRAFLALREVERVEAIRRGWDALHEASLTRFAFHDGKGLEAERRRLMTEIGVPLVPQTAMPESIDQIDYMMRVLRRKAEREKLH